MLREKYFDNAATTPLDPRVLGAMLPWLGDHWGNANSIHSLGLEARAAVEKAREKVALAIGADDPSEIVFTSGATEANNWLLAAHPGAYVSPIEHSSIWEQVHRRNLKLLHRGHLRKMWGEPRVAVPPGDDYPGWEKSDEPFEVDSSFVPEKSLVSLMWINNETGMAYWRPGAGKVHQDLTQAITKVAKDIDGLDYASFSAHKFHGPKGVGALYARGADFPEPLLMGGEHEYGFRAGTLNVPAIVGMGEAIQIAMGEMDRQRPIVEGFQSAAIEELRGLSDWHAARDGLPPGATPGIFPVGSHVSPYVLSLSFLGIEGESLVIEMDRHGYAISSGAACSSRSTEPSHVLTALGYQPEWLRGTIRISFGRFNTLDETVKMARSLRESVESLRRLGR